MIIFLLMLACLPLASHCFGLMKRGFGDVRASLRRKRREKADEDDAYIFVIYLSVWTKVSFLMQAVRQREAASVDRTFDARKGARGSPM